MGSGYNTSLAAGRSARNKAATRTPVYFYLDVPYYVYELPCKDSLTGEPHTFRSRTPATTFDGKYVFWCDRCREYREARALTHQPVSRPHTQDEVTALEQDKGILRERIGRALQGEGFLESDEQIAAATTRDWSLEPGIELRVPVSEIKRINAALVAPEGLAELPEVCAAGLHEMSPDNIKSAGQGSRGQRRCLACYREADRKSKADKRARTRSAQVQKAA